MKVSKKLISLILALILLTSAMAFTVSAKEVESSPYLGYEYNVNSESISAPITYMCKEVLNSDSFGAGTSMKTASDMYYHGEKLYILDSENGRIIELDKNFKVIMIHGSFLKDGEEISYAGANGITVSDDGLIYVADTEGKRILIADKQDRIINIIEKPDEATVGFDFTFDVIKVIVNRQGALFAIVKSVNDGAFVFSSEGKFERFFGKNSVVKTTDVILNFFKKRLLSREQYLKTKSVTPNTLANFDIDSDDFVYTISRSLNSTSAASVNKINYKGSNIFKTSGIIGSFGDLEWDRQSENSQYTSFSDVDIDNEGFINLMDSGRGKIFQYTQNGQLIGTFGGFGNQVGTFSEPVAVESIGDSVIVLDINGTLTKFVPTDYGNRLRTAFINLDTSDAKLAVSEWKEVLALNTNSLYAYYGLGMAYEKLGDYKSAIECFKLSESQQEYSDAFREYRKQVASDFLWLIVAVVIVIIASVITTVVLLKKKKLRSREAAFSTLESKYTFPLYTLFHPADGFGQFKYRRDLPSLRLSVSIVAVMFLVEVYNYFGKGYAFNNNDPMEYSIIVTLIPSVIMYILFVVGHWAVCSLFEGNGTIKEIAAVTAYSLIPYIISRFFCVVLTNVLTLDESVILSIITAIGVIWSVIILMMGLTAVNQYYFGRQLFTTIITIFAMLVIALIAFLFISLMHQVVYFINSVWQEYLLL